VEHQALQAVQLEEMVFNLMAHGSVVEEAQQVLE
jgi:hypothetical protein